MRRKVKNRNVVSPDFRHSSVKVGKLINYIMREGEKETARRVVYRAFDLIREKTKLDPIEVYETALKNTGPLMEVRSRRIGGANYQVPREVRPERRFMLSLRWIIGASRSKKGQPMHVKLADELVAASKNEGAAIKKKEDTHRMAESNKAFAHFTW